MSAEYEKLRVAVVEALALGNTAEEIARATGLTRNKVEIIAVRNAGRIQMLKREVEGLGIYGTPMPRETARKIAAAVADELDAMDEIQEAKQVEEGNTEKEQEKQEESGGLEEITVEKDQRDAPETGKKGRRGRSDRTNAVIEMLARGVSGQEIAEKTGMTAQRISEIKYKNKTEIEAMRKTEGKDMENNNKGMKLRDLLGMAVGEQSVEITFGMDESVQVRAKNAEKILSEALLNDRVIGLCAENSVLAVNVDEL